MIKPDFLHTLIHSLTPTEKRYTSLFASRLSAENGNVQMKLFELLSVMNEYDEAKLISRIDSPSISRNLLSEKSQLYKTILLAMRSYHEQAGVDVKIRNLQSEAEFLFEKRLYDLSTDQLKKAKKLAVDFERQTALLEILKTEADILKEKKNSGMKKEIEENQLMQRETLKQLVEEAQLGMKRNSIFVLTREALHTSEDFAVQAGHFLPEGKAELLEDHGFNFNYNRLTVFALFHTKNKNYKEAARIYELLYQLWEKFPNRHESDALVYKKMMSNYIVVSQYLNQHELVRKLIDLLKKHPCKNSEQEAEQFQTTAFAELMLLMNTNRWNDLAELIRNIEEGLNTYKTKINKARELAFRYNISISWFVLGNLKASLFWMNQIIETEKTDIRKDLQHIARLFRVILYFELGKHDLLEFEVINVERYFRQRKTWTKWEASVLKLIKKLIDTEKSETELLLGKFLENSKEIDNSIQSIGQNEILLWAKAKRDKREIKELFLK